ncbi:16S rRNA (uracil(1498)-N(3))-methyltransferase [bacterium]|jgi:16S rRNA (uracil1498-N3)-methyltransferase|nr:16S rRNA (uracil(1498)-N(3))-methyltransferase [bacterium]
MTRLFITSDMLSNNVLTLPKEVHHHVRRVLRAQPKDPLTLIKDGTHLLQTAIVEIESSSITISIQEQLPIPKRTQPKVILVQALPKQDKMSDILRACSELGVDQFIPLITERVVRIMDDKKTLKNKTRWESILWSAAMQAQSNTIPTIDEPRTLSELFAHPDIKSADLKLVPWEDEPTLLKGILSSQKKPESIVILIGPEGGLSAKEVTTLTDNGFHSVSLGKTILRTEHAGLVTVAQVLYQFS